jgi:hypothetical protein
MNNMSNNVIVDSEKRQATYNINGKQITYSIDSVRFGEAVTDMVDNGAEYLLEGVLHPFKYEKHDLVHCDKEEQVSHFPFKGNYSLGTLLSGRWFKVLK